MAVRMVTKRKIKIKMYNVGFGDCFLVQIPAKDRPRRILFDCGSIKANGIGIKQVAAQVVADCTDANGAHIDLIICTHRHKDHVSGFAADVWNDVEVGEVWMPWTEHPTDKEARRIRDLQARMAEQLRLALGLAEDAADIEVPMSLPNALALNALSNAAAMDTLHNGFAGTPKRQFLPGKSLSVSPITLDFLPGVRLFVLGPSHDEDVIRDMDPPKGQSYLAFRAGLDENGKPPEPFGPDWRYTSYTGGIEGLALSQRDKSRIDSFSCDIDGGMAVALDKAVNGTSLMIVISVGKLNLLFPGDAQWGTWNSALAVPEWRTLLKKTSFYKVGHHGSHNATPVGFVSELLPDDFWGMISTHHVDQWPRIPKAELLTALAKKTKHLARSDNNNKLASFVRDPAGNVEVSLPY